MIYGQDMESQRKLTPIHQMVIILRTGGIGKKALIILLLGVRSLRAIATFRLIHLTLFPQMLQPNRKPESKPR